MHPFLLKLNDDSLQRIFFYDPSDVENVILLLLYIDFFLLFFSNKIYSVYSLCCIILYMARTKNQLYKETSPCKKIKQLKEVASSKQAPKAKPQQPWMVLEPSNDNERFFNKYFKDRCYASS